MIRSCKYLFYLIIFFTFKDVGAIDTLIINQQTDKINLYKQISIYEDTNSVLTIDQLIDPSNNYQFVPNSKNKLNFEFSTSTFWLKFIIKNNTSEIANYILEIPNPDIDHLNFYHIHHNKVLKEFKTGELHDAGTREIFHRYFLFSIRLYPGETSEYCLSVNNIGHSLTVPLLLANRLYFLRTNRNEDIFNWLIYGLILFIIFFNIYLYRSTRDKVNLYNAFNIFFAATLFLIYDNYILYLNPPIIMEKTKWLSASLYTIFLLTFTEAFIGNTDKFKGLRKLFNPLKVLAIIAALSYPLRYPFSLISDIGIPFLILASQVFLLIIAFAYYNRRYSPSILLVLAFSFVFLGLLIHELKEMNILNLNFFVLNSLKIGLTIECILLTIAVLERFRINLEQAKRTIQDSYDKIGAQNKELEIINSELEKLSIVASETNNNVAIYDPKGKIEWCNTHFELFYRTTLSELIKSKHDSIYDIIPNKMIQDLFEKCITNKKSITFETHVRSEEAMDVWAQTTLTPLIRNRKVYKLIAIDSDISKLKQYEKNLVMAKEKAIESDRLKTVFLGNMSHEIRTPLNGIMGFSDLLLNTETDEEKRNRYLNIIASNGEQLLRIIDDIIDISLIESNQMKIHLSPFNLIHFINEVGEFFQVLRDTLGKTNIDLIIENDIKADESIMVSDPIRLKQVLNNLMRNALKFTKEGYIKLICSKQDSSSISFCIEDTGIGLDPEKKHIIFERFRQADERVSREFGGTGLGLAISRGIIEKLKGKIWVDTNHSPGLKICFSIPVHQTGYEEKEEDDNKKQQESIPDVKLN